LPYGTVFRDGFFHVSCCGPGSSFLAFVCLCSRTPYTVFLGKVTSRSGYYSSQQTSRLRVIFAWGLTGLWLGAYVGQAYFCSTLCLETPTLVVMLSTSTTWRFIKCWIIGAKTQCFTGGKLEPGTSWRQFIRILYQAQRSHPNILGPST